MPIFGIDVSHHQGGSLDWAKIRGSGIDFMFARASLATTPDETYRRNHRRAREAGIPVLGAYHFLYPESVVPGGEQARLFVDRIGDPTGLLTMLDIERDDTNKPHIKAVREFATTFAALTDGHPLLMYAPAWYWGIIGDPPASDLGPLVASHYVHVDRNANKKGIKMAPDVAFARVRKGFWHARHGGWTHATILQFTSYGRVDGHPRRVDVNAFRGTVDELRALATKGGPPPPVDPDDLVDDDTPDDTEPDEGLSHGSTDLLHHHGLEPLANGPQFHVVVHGDNLSDIATRFGWKPAHGKPAFQVMIDAFPENAQFRADPGSIRPGQRVRVA